jgi:hypothetical protein
MNKLNKILALLLLLTMGFWVRANAQTPNAQPTSQPDAVAVTLSPDTPAIIMLRTDAQQEFTKLCTDGTDDQRLRALAVALNPLPDWPQFVMNNDASVCNRNPKPISPLPIEKPSGKG